MSEYTEVDHPLQRAIRAATEEVTGETVAGYGIDGCSAPNFAMSVRGLARAMAAFAAASEDGNTRERAMARLRKAMALHPELVAGEGRACTELMRAMGGRASIKTGAEAVFVAMLPEQKLGIALKIEDGNGRASEAVIVALLAKLGVLDARAPDGAKTSARAAGQLARLQHRRAAAGGRLSLTHNKRPPPARVEALSYRTRRRALGGGFHTRHRGS